MSSWLDLEDDQRRLLLRRVTARPVSGRVTERYNRFYWCLLSFHNEFFVPVGVRFSMYLSCASAASFLSTMVSLREAAFNLLFAPGDLCSCHSLRCRRFSSTSSLISLLVLLNFVLHTWLSCGVDAFAAAKNIYSISPPHWSMSSSVSRGLEKPVWQQS